MKKLLAIVLAAVLLLGLVPFAGAAFTDAAKISAANKTAVEYVSEKGVISGFPDGSFRPQETLTRAQAAKILCVAVEGAEKSAALTKTDAGFSDLPASNWAAKFVTYCVEKKIVAGVGNGRFDPDGKLTAAAFAKMLLVAFGKEKAENLVGTKWLENTQKALKQDKLDDGVSPVENKPVTRENACRLAYNFLAAAEKPALPEGYQETTLTFTDAGKYRLLGRALQDKDGVVCDACADGVEFTVDCAGSIELTASVTNIETYNVTFRVIVDGKASDQFSFSSAGEKSKVLVKDVEPGVHTIRVVKDYELSQSKDMLKSLKLACKPETIKPTEQKKKLIVYIGDSDTAGVGVIPTNTPDSTKNSASAILSHGYLAAEKLNADYEIVARRSLGAVRKIGKPTEYNFLDMFEYQNRWRDGKTKYGFTRKADAVVIKVSGNDRTFSAEEVKTALKKLIEIVRGHYGADVPIALYYSHSTQHKAVAEELLKEDPKLKSILITYDRNGMGKHSTAEAHAGYAEEIVKVFKPLIGG